MKDKIDIKSHKIMNMDPEKRERIINASMREFCKGYKNASTDVIVREAGISKGLLFHYFGTKEGLYEFIIQYSFDILGKEYFGLINVEQRDLLERLWQTTLLKMDLSYKHPDIFELMAKVYAQYRDGDGTADGVTARIKSMQDGFGDEVLKNVFKNIDTSLFKDGIDIEKAVNIIKWTLFGYAD